MVRAPAQTARGAGWSPAWRYSFPCIYDCSKEKNLISSKFFSVLEKIQSYKTMYDTGILYI